MRLSHLLILSSILIGPIRLAFAQNVVGEMFASDASVHGSVLFARGGTQIQSGSSVSAGNAAALLKLKRGGDVRICPRTTVSVASSANGRDLLWGMNIGSIEAHYVLPASADTVLTPDFRILLAGPGNFHFAISADSKGNACVKSLPENTASLIVNELNGDATYQVKPNEQIVFRGGHIANPDSLLPPDCGCPPPVAPVQVAATPAEPKNDQFAKGGDGGVPPLPSVPNDANLPTRPVMSDTAHLELESPFIYKAGDPEQEMALAVGRLRLTSGANLPKAIVLPPDVPQPEPKQAAVQKQAKNKQKKGIFRKIGSFFSSIFR